MKLEKTLALASLLCFLAACSSGGDDITATDNNRVPASALVSAQAYTQFVQEVTADNNAELVDVDGITAPKSETALPIPLT